MDTQESQNLQPATATDILLTFAVKNQIALSTIIEYLKTVKPEDAELISKIKHSQAAIIVKELEPILSHLFRPDQSSTFEEQE